MPRRIIAPGRSCLECRRRKIKCDRAMPCAYCTVSEVQCEYPSTARRVSREANNTLCRQVDNLSATVNSLSGHLSRIQAQLHDKTESITEQSRDPAEADVNQSVIHSLPFIGSMARPSTRLFHPSPSDIMVIWQTYLEIIDPVVKIFHVPTMQKHIAYSIRDLSNIDNSTQCALFAIYYATALVTPAEDCDQYFHSEKESLLAKYRTGVEESLVQANLLTTQNFMVLQALTLYITCARRDSKVPEMSSLIGLAVSVAMKMGLNCVDSMTSLTPFDMELRRRLWWQLSTLDVRIAEDYHVRPNILASLNTTSFPANIDDSLLQPTITQAPRSESRRTEMLYNLARFQGSHFLREIVFSDEICREQGYKIRTVAEKCDFIDSYWAKIENELLCFCDPSVPIDNITLTSVRLIMVKSKLTIMKPNPQQKQDAPVRESYRQTCQQVLEYAHNLRQYEPGKKWLWLFQTYIEWDALAYLLLDLSLFSEGDTDHLWKTIEEIYAHWTGTAEIRKDRRWAHVEELHEKALAARAHARPPVDKRRTRNSLQPMNTDISLPNLLPIRQPDIGPDPVSNIDALWSQITGTHQTPDGLDSQPGIAVDSDLVPCSGSMPDWDQLLFDRYWQAVE